MPAVGSSQSSQLQGVQVRATWCDRLRPRTFGECLMHDAVNERLRALVYDAKARNELPHIMLTGPAGCGKRTRASCLIAALYQIRRSELYRIFELLPTRTANGGHVGAGDGSETALAPTLDEMLQRINTVVRDGKEVPLSEQEQRSDACNVPVNVVLTRARTITCDKAKDGIQVLHSPVHVEMTPHDVNFCDTKIVQSTLKTLFESSEFDLLTLGAVPSLCRFDKGSAAASWPVRRQQEKAQQKEQEKQHAGEEQEKEQEKEQHVNPRFRVFVFNNVDKMSREAQTALRRIMEDYSTVARFIVIAVNIDHVIAPIQSRCHIVTVPRPDDQEVEHVLESALFRVAPPGVLASEAVRAVVKPYIAKLAAQSDGNVTKALTVMQASLHSLLENHDALVVALRRFDIAQPDWLQSMRDCVQQICQVSMRSSTTRHVYIKDTLSELLKRRVPTEYIVCYLDQHVRRTLREQALFISRSMQQLLDDNPGTNTSSLLTLDGGGGSGGSGGEERVSEEERRYLQRQLQSIKCQLAGVCSDVSTACAFYETRSTKSQYAVIHISALALCLVVIVGLYQNSLALTLDAGTQLRVCRPYSAVYELGRLLCHTMQRLGTDASAAAIAPATFGASAKQTTGVNVTGGGGSATSATSGAGATSGASGVSVAQQMKQLCLASNSLAGVDWRVVRQQAKEQNIAVDLT